MNQSSPAPVFLPSASVDPRREVPHDHHSQWHARPAPRSVFHCSPRLRERCRQCHHRPPTRPNCPCPGWHSSWSAASWSTPGQVDRDEPERTVVLHLHRTEPMVFGWIDKACSALGRRRNPLDADPDMDLVGDMTRLEEEAVVVLLLGR